MLQLLLVLKQTAAARKSKQAARWAKKCSPRWRIERWTLALCGVLFATQLSAANYTAARIWPAREYSRVTLEAPGPIQYSFFTLTNPHRLVVDLQDTALNEVLTSLPAKLSGDDPHLKSVRAGRNRPGVVRLAFDLKMPVQANVFTVKPVAGYGHRLVLDIYPAAAPDPLMAVLAERAQAQVQTVNGATPHSTPQTAAQQEVTAPTEGATAANQPAAQSAPEVKTAAAAMETPAPRSSDAPAPARSDEQALIVVAIDAGHGGEDPGATGQAGTLEKHVTLAIAKLLKQAIDADGSMRAVLTRDGDYFIALGDRVKKARRAQADLFVSIHADAFVSPHARGSSVFALSQRSATSAAARWLAERENRADLIGGISLKHKDPNLARTLLDLSQTATIDDSLKLGRAVLMQLGGLNRLHKRRVEQAGFAVLKAPDIPSILVETAFISNPHEEKRLADADYQARMAQAILAGIKRYAAKQPRLNRSKLALK